MPQAASNTYFLRHDGRDYEVRYDGTQETFAARDISELGRQVSVEAAADLYAALKLQDLLVDLNATPAVVAAEDFLAAARGVAATYTVVDGLSTLTTNIAVFAGGLYLGSGKAGARAVIEAASVTAAGLKEVRLQDGFAAASLALFEGALQGAANNAIAFAEGKTSVQNSLDSGAVVSTRDIILNWSLFSSATESANGAIGATRSLDLGGGNDWIDSTGWSRAGTVLGDFLLEFGKGAIGLAVAEGANFAGKFTAPQLAEVYKARAEDLTAVVFALLEVDEAIDSAQRFQLATQLERAFGPAPNPFDSEVLESIAEGFLTLEEPASAPGFQGAWDVDGGSPDAPAPVVETPDGAVLTGVMDTYDTSDFYSVEVPGGVFLDIDLRKYDGSIPFDFGIYNSTGIQLVLTRNNDRFISEELTGGIYTVEILRNSNSARDSAGEEYSLDVVFNAGSSLIGADDTRGGAQMLGDLGSTPIVASDDLGGAEGFDRSDFYEFTVTETRKVTVTLSGIATDAEIELSVIPKDGGFRHPQLFQDDLGDLLTKEYTLPAGTYLIQVAAPAGVVTPYSFEIERGGAAEAGGTFQPTQNDDFFETSTSIDLLGGNDTVVVSGITSGNLEGGSGYDTLIFDNSEDRLGFYGVDSNGDRTLINGDLQAVNQIIADSVDIELRTNFSNSSSSYIDYSGFEEIQISSNSNTTFFYSPLFTEIVSEHSYDRLVADWSDRSNAIHWDSNDETPQEVVSGFTVVGNFRSIAVATGSGDDVITGDGEIRTNDGDDTVYGGGTVDTGTGDDKVFGGGTIDLGTGNDFVDLMAGSGTVDGGAGQDIAVYDMLGVRGAYFTNYSMSARYRDVDNNWVAPTGTTDEVLDLLSLGLDWGIYTRAGKNTNVGVRATFENVEEIRLGGASGNLSGAGGDRFYAFENVKSVKGYLGKDSLYADWSNETDAIIWNNLDDEVDLLANGFQIDSIETTYFRTGSGDDDLAFSGFADTGAGDDIVALGNGEVRTGSGEDTVTLTYDGLFTGHIAHLGADDDRLFTDGRGGTFDGGSGTDTINLSLDSFRWDYDVADGSSVPVSATFESVEAMLAHYNAGGSIRAYHSQSNSTVSQHLVDFEVVHQQAAANNPGLADLLIDFGSDAHHDAGGGTYDSFYADWSALTERVVWDNTDSKQAFIAPTGASVVNAEALLLKTGSGDDALWLGSRNDTVETGTGDDFVDSNGGVDHISTGAGNDAIDIDTAFPTSTAFVDAGAGDDTVRYDRSTAGEADGGAGDDRLIFLGERITYGFDVGDGSETAVNMSSDIGTMIALIDHVRAGGLATIYHENGTRAVDFEGFERADIWGHLSSLLIDFGGDAVLRGSDSTDRFFVHDGADLMQGGLGRDTYLLRDGFGNDVIEDTTAFDYVDFVEADASDLTFSRAGFELRVDHTDGSRLTVQDYFSDTVVGREWVFRASGIDLAVDMTSIAGNIVTPTGVEAPTSDFTANLEAQSTSHIGTADVDLLAGDQGPDRMFGRAGNDIISGGAGDDVIYAQGGDDLIDGGAGADFLHGGTGVDRVSYFSSILAVAIDLGVGEGTGGDAKGDTYLEIEKFVGSVHGDLLRGGALADDLSGNLGDDFLVGAEGDDVLSADGGDDRVYGNEGDDLIWGGTGEDELRGDEDDDMLFGESGNDTLFGGEGSDTLDGGGGADSLEGGTGVDVASYQSSTLGVKADLQFSQFNDNDATGDDYTAIENLEGTAAQDDLRGDGQDNGLRGLDGNDFLTGRNGDDVLDGGAGGDRLFGSSGNDTASYANASVSVKADLEFAQLNTGDAEGDTYNSIENMSGTEFSDDLRGDAAANTISGSDGNDYLNGRDGNDALAGGGGDDVLIGGEGADHHSGGSGIDRASYQSSASGLRADLLFSQLNTGIASGDSYDSIENTRGSNFDDTLGGNSASNLIEALHGNDTITGRGGNDKLLGAGGDDVLLGGEGSDSLFGAVGTDRASYADSASGVTADLQNSALNAGSFAVGDTYSQIEDLQGSAQGDNLRGNGADNALIGGNGDDFLTGRNGDDVLLGGGGNDVLRGGNGGDVLNGGAGIDQADYIAALSGVRVDLEFGSNNTGIASGDSYVNVENLRGGQSDDDLRGDGLANLIEGFGGDDFLTGRGGDDELRGSIGDDFLNGGTGADLLVGSTGADRFRFNKLNEGGDTILDFQVNTDILQLNNAAGGFTSLSNGALAAGSFVNDSAALDADDFILYDSANGELSYDADGSGAGSAILIAILQNTAAIDENDFFVV